MRITQLYEEIEEYTEKIKHLHERYDESVERELYYRSLIETAS